MLCCCRATLQSLWIRLWNASDWESIAAQRFQLLDADFQQVLLQEPICRAAAICYGPSGTLEVPNEFVMNVLAENTSSMTEAARDVVALALQAGMRLPGAAYTHMA